MTAIQINYLNANYELIASYRSADAFTAENLKAWTALLKNPPPGEIWTAFELVPWQYLSEAITAATR